MKQVVLILIFSIVCAGQSIAADNICSEAGPLVNSASIQIDGFYEKYVQRTFDGAGRVRDIKSGGLASKLTVVVDCGNNVLVDVPTSSHRATGGLKIGDSINFSGKLNSVSRKRYVDSHKWYLMVGLDDNSSAW